MTTIKSFITRHPVLTYFVLVFAMSWGGLILMIGQDSLPLRWERFERPGPLLYLTAIAGPQGWDLLSTGLVTGRVGLRELLGHLLRLRVDAHWYVVALLATPLLAAVSFALELLSPEFLLAIVTTDDKASLLMTGLQEALPAIYLG